MEINVLTHKVIGCAYKVHNTLGFGFLAKSLRERPETRIKEAGHYRSPATQTPGLLRRPTNWTLLPRSLDRRAIDNRGQSRGWPGDGTRVEAHPLSRSYGCR